MEIPNYVMMPVPEQLVPRVMEHILWLMARDAMKQWDEESFGELFHEASEKTKAVLSLTARRRLADKEVTADMVGDLLGIALSEVWGSIRAINQEAHDRLRPTVCSTNTVEEQLANGRKVRKHLIDMTENVAQLIEKADAAEREQLKSSTSSAG